MSFITTDQHFLLAAVMMVVVAFSFWAERFRWGHLISGTLIAILSGLILSNLKIIPFSAPAYGFVQTYPLMLAIPLLLFRADLRRLWKEGGRVLAVFCLGAVGTVSGVLLAAALVNLEAVEAKLAGMFAGSFIGGSMNFVAVSKVVDLQDQTTFTLAIAADNLSAALVMMVLIALPAYSLSRKFFGYDERDHVSDEADQVDHHNSEINIQGLAISLGTAGLLVALSIVIAGIINQETYTILVLPLLSLLIANFAPKLVDSMRGDYDVGVYFMSLFFVTIGAGADVGTLFEQGTAVFTFMIITVSIHLIIVLLFGKFFGFTLPEIMTGSNACVLGPTTAMAVAASRGWNHLVIPAVLSGVFGYAIGTFLGVGVFEFLS